MTRLTRVEWSALLVSVLLFSISAFPYLSLPGPYQDELLYFQALEPYAYGSTLYAWSVGDVTIPLMIMSYVGGLKANLIGLTFALLPPSIETIRAFGLCLGLVIVVLLALFLRCHYTKRAAIAATLLLATDATFIHTIRVDWGPVALMQLLKAAGLLALSVWLTNRRPVWLAGGMFLFGMALWDKANFIWFLFALGTATLIVFPKRTLVELRPKTVLIAGLAFLAGSSPLWTFNLDRHGLTASDTTKFELRTTKLFAVPGSLDGSGVFWLMTRLDPHASEDPLEASERAPRALALFARARLNLTGYLILAGLLTLPFSLRTPHRRAILFALLVSVLNYAAMFPFEGAAGSAHHIIMLHPFPIVFAVASLAALAERWKRPRWAAAVFAVALLFNLSLNARYLTAFAHTGGSAVFTDATYGLIHHLSLNPQYRYHLFDWGMSNSLAFLGHRHKLNWTEHFGIFANSNSAQQKQQQLDEILNSPTSRLILRGSEKTVFPHGRTLVDQWVKEGRFRRVEQIHERNGDVAFEIYAPNRNQADAEP